MLPCSLTWMLWHCCWYFGVLPSFPTSIRRAYTLQSALFSTLTPTLALSPTVTNLPSQRSAKIHRIWFNCTFPIDGYIMLHLHCSEMIHWFHRWIPSFYRFVLRLHVCRHFLDGELPFCCFNTMMANSYHGRGTRELATVAHTQGSAEVHQWRWVQKDVEDLGTKIHRSLEVDCAPPKYDKQIDE